MNLFNQNLSVNRPIHLPLLFKHLNTTFGPFIVLRGYNELPNGYTNDIDIFIPKCRLSEYREAVVSYPGCEAVLQVNISRLGLLKCELILGGDLIQIDIIYGFYYAGLSYQNTRDLLVEAKMHDSGFFLIPRHLHEIHISLLKEILHNGRVRVDKAQYLLNGLESTVNEFKQSFFNKRDIESVIFAINRNCYKISLISMQIRAKLLLFNLINFPIASIHNIVLFFVIKYILRNKYHLKLFK